MIRFLFGAAVAAGVSASLWVAWTHAGSHPAILPVLALILAAFFTGVRELHRFRVDTGQLQSALVQATAAPPANVTTWLSGLPPDLQGPVRARLAGQRVPLPGPALTPYLTGLLVLLGLLGTFLGMVATLSGTVTALNTSSDLQTIRGALALPVQGLGLAFGTSVAGVATSAALGLMAALARNERALASRALEAAVHSSLWIHTAAAQREQQWQGLQSSLRAAMDRSAEQLEHLPTVLTQGLDQVAQRMETVLQRTSEQLQTVLQEGLHAGLQTGGAAMRAQVEPLLRESLQGLSRQLAVETQQALERLTAIGQQSDQTLSRLAGETQALLAQQSEATHTMLVDQNREATQRQLDLVEVRIAGWMEEVRTVQSATEREWACFAAQSLEALEAQGARFAEREQADGVERQRLLSAVDTLMAALHRTTSEQAQRLDALLVTAADQLQRSATQFDGQAAAVALRLESASSQTAAASDALTRVGDGFAQAIQGYTQVNADLGQQLARIEQALGAHLERSDEQLAYYVAQARELVELTLGAQQQLLENLRSARQASARSAAEAV